jgi:hypothetical protein
MISGLRPTSSTLAFIRIPTSALVRLPASMPVAVIVMLDIRIHLIQLPRTLNRCCTILQGIRHMGQTFVYHRKSHIGGM